MPDGRLLLSFYIHKPIDEYSLVKIVALGIRFIGLVKIHTDNIKYKF